MYRLMKAKQIKYINKSALLIRARLYAVISENNNDSTIKAAHHQKLGRQQLLYRLIDLCTQFALGL